MPERGRRPGESGARAAIEAAARRQFSELGFDRTSLRSVAHEAGVDPGLVRHYFGTKPQLFVGVVELPVDPAVVVPVLMEGDAADVGRRLAQVLVGVMDSEEGRRRMTGLVRAAVSEPEAAQMLRELIADRLFGPLTEHLDIDRPELRAALCGSQTVGLVMARHIVGVEPLASVHAEQLIDAVGATFQRYLTEPL